MNGLLRNSTECDALIRNRVLQLRLETLAAMKLRRVAHSYGSSLKKALDSIEDQKTLNSTPRERKTH